MNNPFDSEQRIYLHQQYRDLQLSELEIKSKEFDNCIFTNCNFSGTYFNRCKFYECSFTGCNLSLVKVNQTSFFDIYFDKCKVIGINWTVAAWPSLKLSCPLKFTQCILNDSCFSGLSLREIEMSECKAHDVDFREADCSAANFMHTDFYNSLFNNTNLTEANFCEAINYRVNIYFNEIKQAKFSLPEATSLLNCLDIEIIE